MRPAHFLLAALLSMPALTATGSASTETDRSSGADAAVGRQLDELGYRYEVDDDGDYKMLFDLDKGRSQLAFVISGIEEFGDLRVREVWAPAYRSAEASFPAGIANRLLEDSHASKLGSWVKQGDIAVFVVKLDANASTGQLEAAIDYVLRAADQMEAELTGQDEF